MQELFRQCRNDRLNDAGPDLAETVQKMSIAEEDLKNGCRINFIKTAL
jgi:hypothetical protein